MQRRSFIKKTAISSAVLSVPYYLKGHSITKPTGKNSNLFIGAPVLPEYLLENGIADSLDKMQELAGIKTVMTFSHAHVFRQYSQGFKPKQDAEGIPISDVFIKTNPKFYADPALQGRSPGTKYDGRDILNELYEETQKRGMQVYARILEPYRITGVIPGFEAFAEINSNGELGQNVCFNHPDYIAYWNSVIEDLITTHPFMHGFKFGQERAGPLHDALNARPGTCFCEHCMKIAKERRIDMNIARKGIKALQEFVDNINQGNLPIDGNFVTFLRIISNFPDLLSLEKMWMDSREEQRKRIYKQIKSINSSIQIGWHIDHGMTWDLFTRAFNNYALMGSYSDWLSTAVYFDSMGRRSLNHYNKTYRKLLFGDATADLSYPMYLSMLGYDPNIEAPLNEHETRDTAFSAEYVFAECSRAVKAVKGTTKIYARPGWDMPGYDCNIQPEQVYKVVTRALDAGVDGLWCGREWDELQEKNIIAFGKAISDYK